MAPSSFPVQSSVHRLECQVIGRIAGHRSASHFTGKILLLLITILLLVNTVAGQQTSNTDGKTPTGLATGAPAGSYALSGFENVNLFNGGLSFKLPLLTIGGRGSAGYTMTLPIEQKWIVKAGQTSPGGITPLVASPNWWTGKKPGYGPGVLQGRRTIYEEGRGYNNNPDGEDTLREIYLQTLTRLTFTAADGTEYELRDQATGGQPFACSWYPQEGDVEGFSRGKVFITADGSAATFISEAPLRDRKAPVITTAQHLISPTGYLLLKDGTRYRIVDGEVSWIRDRNGNQVTFGVDTITDSLNRTVTITHQAAYDEISYPGFGGPVKKIRVWYDSLESRLRPNSGFSTQSHQALFGLNTNIAHYNPSRVVSKVELPNAKTYKFYYNPYGELARVVLPTGGAFEYDWEGTTSVTDQFIFRYVTKRRVYLAEEGAVQHETRYNREQGEVKTFNGSGALLSFSKHYFYGDALQSMTPDPSSPPAISFSPWQDGREYKTQTFEVISGVPSETPHQTVEHTWEQPVAGSTWPLTQAETSPLAKPNDPQITATTTTLADTSQVGKQTFAYDRYSNRTDSYEYDFETGAAGSLVRRAHTDFLTTNPVNSSDYACNPATTCDNNANIANVIHLRSLPAQSQVFDAGSNERARTTFEYDKHSDTNHAALVDRSGISGLDSAFGAANSKRGNVTATTSYILGTSTTISSYAQYDIAGNVVKTIDGRGYQTTIAYTDCFGSADGNAQNCSAPLELSAVSQASYAFASSATNALGHVVYSQFDYHTGRPVDAQDANGQISSFEYNDELDRPTRAIRAVGTAAANQTTIHYNDEDRITTTSSDLTTYGDNALVSKAFYDGLGRTTETRQYEGGSNYIASQQQYDALGRAFKTSNPFRPWQSESPIWTTIGFDALGRVISSTTPDNAVMSTSYSGNTITVTDQAGKKRKSVTDALGRLVSVYEDPNGLNYQTNYSYDTLDNLTSVTQGSQTRTFAYDSLKRLKSATNPESGTICYGTVSSSQCQADGYDANSNLVFKTDARGVRITYAYDALNRNTTVNYSNTTIGNPDIPDITRTYDTATNGKGRLRESYAGGNETVGTTVEHTKIHAYDALGRPLDQRQRFKTNSVWSAEYQTGRSYNLAGGVASQTYPSGHTVSYAYDSAGRNSSFSGSLGDGTQRTYSSEMIYSALGALTKEKFGTDTAIYNKLFYNSRGQLAAIRTSTSYTGPADTTSDRGAIINHYSNQPGCSGADCNNNGNLRAQEVYIPRPTSGSDTFVQSYDYDALNRLQVVSEKLNGGAVQWQQKYVYDRWGNRTIAQGVTETYGAGINKKDFTANVNNDNRLGVPAGQTGTMTYDAAGNLTTDTYSGAAVTRVYDAENRMTQETQASSYVAGLYTYNADGQRVRRKVNGVETWQVYGLDGELLAEYKSGAAPFVPAKEYGYRGGQLLVTMSSGDDVRLARFVTNLYYGALQRDPTAPELQDGVNQLAAAGAQSQAQLFSVASQIARSLFTATNYETSPYRSDAQYLTDLYYAYLQRGPDDNGLGWWMGQVASNGRVNVCNGFEASAEFATLVATLYGTVTSGYDRTEYFINRVYVGAYGRNATATEMTQQRDALNAAAAQGPSQVQAQAESFGRSLFVSQVNDAGISNTQFVTNLYEAFLQRGPDAGGLSFWSGQASVGAGRQNVLNAIATCGPFYEVAGTLYREAFWLVADHLGTPRLIVNKSGSLAGIKRHDYLPFGEDIFAGTGSRTTTMGYSAADGVRQKFTSKERDNESGLDYFLARYYASNQGRFTSVDPLVLKLKLLGSPQDLNRYSYVANSPLGFVDPDGKDKIQVVIDTYIPTKVSPPIDHKRFEGDDRRVPEVGQPQGGGSFRTQQIVTIETDQSQDVGGTPQNWISKGNTGISSLVNCSGERCGPTAQASGDTLTAGVTRNKDGSVEINAHGNESNPLIASPGITYNYNINVKDDGKGGITVTVSGSHDQYPAHVVTASKTEQPNSKAITVYSFSPVDARTTPYSLLPPAKDRVIQPRPVKLP